MDFRTRVDDAYPSGNSSYDEIAERFDVGRVAVDDLVVLDECGVDTFGLAVFTPAEFLIRLRGMP